MSSQGDAQFEAALRAALAASDSLDEAGKGNEAGKGGAGGKDTGGQQKSGGKPSSKSEHAEESESEEPHGPRPRHEPVAPPRSEKPPRPVDHPKGTRPTVQPPKQPIKAKNQPKPGGKPKTKRGIPPKLKAGAGLAGGLAMGAMSSGMDWRQLAQDPKAALNGLKGAAVQAGKDKLAGMMDPANLADAVLQVKDTAASAKERAAQGKNKGQPGAKGGKAGAIAKDEKALKDKTSALKGHTKNLGEYDKTHQKMTENVGKSSKGFNDLAKAHKDSAGAQKNVEGATKNWGKSQDKLNGAMGRSTIGKITEAIQMAIGVVVLLIENWDTVKKAFDTVKKTVLEPVGTFFKSVFAACLTPFTTIIDEVKGVFSGLSSNLGGIFSGVVRQVAVIVHAIGTVVGHFKIELPGWLGGASFGLGGIGAAMTGWAAGHMADGGMVRGPGGPRDDLVPIMASNGEFVVNAAATARYGALLESINKDTLNVSGRDAQVVASLGLSRVKPAQALPGLTPVHRVDRSTTINLTTTQHDSTYARAKTIAAQRDVTYAAGRR